MLAYWRKDDPAKFLCGVPLIPKDLDIASLPRSAPIIAPRIELLHGWTGGRGDDVVYPDEGEHDQGAYAAVMGKGYIMRFCSQTVDHMPDEVAQSVIAHELAHVFQSAIGVFERSDCEPGSGELEENADDLMEFWGFPQDAVDEWAADQGLVKRVVCKDIFEYVIRQYGPGSRYYNPPRETSR
jgi:hypothetical protein